MPPLPDADSPDPELLDPELLAVADAVRVPGRDVSAQWAQVSTLHTGRLLVDGARQPFPAAVVPAFQALRSAMSDSDRGAWFSATITVGPRGGPNGEVAAGSAAVELTPNYSDRVFFNGPDDSLLVAPPAGTAPVPTDADWEAELRRHPRGAAQVPAWLSAPTDADAAAEFPRLRAALTSAGVPTAALRLPGEEHVTFEGALLVREMDPGVFSLDIFDYGQVRHITTETGAPGAGRHAWAYLASVLPPAVALPSAEAQQRHDRAAPAYEQLGRRLAHAGRGGIQTHLAPGVPFDRFGGIDGLYMFAWGTPLAERSLPPSATEGDAARIGLIANVAIPAQAELTPAWFDQPGGGVRFRLPDPIRDHIRRGEISVLVTT